MTVLIKAKGYINNNEWGANKTLLSYSQLAALTSADAVNNELNADPTRYYNALDGDSHIGTIDGNNYIVDGQGNKTIWVQSGGTLADGNYAFYLNNGEWEAESQGPSLKTYEELIAMTAANAVTELNTNASDYYTALSGSSNLWTDSGNSYLGTTSGAYNYDEGHISTGGYLEPGTYVKYSGGTWSVES